MRNGACATGHAQRGMRNGACATGHAQRRAYEDRALARGSIKKGPRLSRRPSGSIGCCVLCSALHLGELLQNARLEIVINLDASLLGEGALPVHLR